MKLREGNVFTGVCVCPQGGPHAAITHDTLDLTVQVPGPTLPMVITHETPNIRHGIPCCPYVGHGTPVALAQSPLPP